MARDIEELDFSELAGKAGDRLLHVQAPLRACLAGAGSHDCTAALASLRNPYYPRLREIKQRYDPANIFRVHHGVGSEATGR
jgi:FAD/FMN-containing dehydrogenase